MTKGPGDESGKPDNAETPGPGVVAAEESGDVRRSGDIVAWGAAAAALLVAVILFLVILSKMAGIAEGRRKEHEAREEAVNVTIRRIEPRTVVDRLRLPGVVKAWDEVWVSARSSGQVAEVLVGEGDDVGAGDVICRIDESDYALAAGNAMAAFERARAAHDLAAAGLARAKGLRADGAMTRARYDEIEAGEREARAALKQAEVALKKAELDLERTKVSAPISGTVSVLPVSVGRVLGHENRVARIVDLRRVKVVVGIPERDVLSVRDLKEVEMTFDALPDRRFTGKVVHLSVEPGERVQVYYLELEVDNEERLLRPGMFAKTDVVREVRPDSVVVPFYAVVGQGQDLYCLVAETAWLNGAEWNSASS